MSDILTAYIQSLMTFSLVAVLCVAAEVLGKPVVERTQRSETLSDSFFAAMAIVLGPMYLLVNVALVDVLIAPYMPEHGLQQWITALSYAFQIFIAVVTLDLIIYTSHRFTHYHLWRVHATHHSVRSVVWLTKYRMHPIDVYVTNLFRVVLFYLVGFEGEAIAWAGMIMLAFDLFNHLNIRLSFRGIWRYVLSCPDYHKWHHATAKNAVNKNFVVVFPWIDALFGSYYFPNHLPKAMGTWDSQKQAIRQPTIWEELVFPFEKLR